MADGTGTLLVRFGLVTASQLEAARDRVAQAGGTIGESLVVMGAVEDDTLTEFYRTRLLVPQVDANSLARISAKTLATVPADVAIELRIIPVALDREGNLTVAMSDPANGRAVDELGFFTSSYVVRNVATQAQIAWCLAKYYNHITELATRQMVPVDPKAEANAEPKSPYVAPGNTDIETKVAATRRRILAPVTAPVEVIRPLSDILDQPALPSRPRTVSGEIRAVTTAAVTPITDEPSGPIITIEADAEATAPLALPPIKKRKAQLPDPPELAARAGELAVAHRQGHSGALEAMPAVLIDLSALEAPVVAVQADRSGEISVGPSSSHAVADAAPSLVEINDDVSGIVTAVDDPASAPILLSPAMAKSHPGIIISPIDDEASEPIELIAKVRERARVARATQLGFAPPPSIVANLADAVAPVDRPRPDRDTQVTSAVLFDEDGLPLDDYAANQIAPPTTALVPVPALVSPSPEARHVAAPLTSSADKSAANSPVAVPTDAAIDPSIPVLIEAAQDSTLKFSIKMVPPAPITPAYDAVDDGWGPPGSTIPPSFAGTANGPATTHETNPPTSSDVIPIAAQDSVPLLIAARETSGPASMWRGAASADAARALEASTAETFRLLTELDRAATRNDVIDALVGNLAKSHRNAAFFVVRSLEVVLFAQRPGTVAMPAAIASLSEPSALQDAYSTRVPYRGGVADPLTATFITKIFGRRPAELLLLPIVIRERTIGIWCGTERDGAAFDEQLALVARAAGTALERIVRNKAK